MSSDSYIQRALETNALRAQIVRAAVETLQLPSGSCGLDAGCGIGLQCVQLAEEVGPSGHVTGLDRSSDFLDHAQEIGAKAGLSERISFRKGDIFNLPFDGNAFDWAWSTDCVGYGPWEPLPPLRELTRVVKPGGTVAILAWSSENLLPGYPKLEARLGTTSAGLAPFVNGNEPESHFLRALGWFRELGLRKPKAKVLADSFHAPLSREIHRALRSLFEMRWPGVESELSSGDRAEFRRLCLAGSEDFILNLPDYYMHFTYTLFWGEAAQ